MREIRTSGLTSGDRKRSHVSPDCGYLLIPGLGLSSLGGIDEALDVTAEFLIQARDGSSS
jgi:hypothetical protein